VARLIQVFEALCADDVAGLGDFYTEQAYFKDPFNEVNGLAAVKRIFKHMFDTLDQPRFVVHDAMAEGEQCLLTWDFLFNARGHAYTVRGSSHLRFAADGRVAYHRDYWDVAEELYEKLPVLGLLMRWLRRRLAS
jgi:ketosteroid isomerase-like protein